MQRKRQKADPQWIFEVLGREGCVDDEISVIANYGPGFRFAHPECRVLRSNEDQVLQNLGVGERCNFHGNTSLPLYPTINRLLPVPVTQRRNTHVSSKVLRVFPVIGDDNEPVGKRVSAAGFTGISRDERVSGLCEDFLPEMAGSAAFDGVQVLINPVEIRR